MCRREFDARFGVFAATSGESYDTVECARRAARSAGTQDFLAPTLLPTIELLPLARPTAAYPPATLPLTYRRRLAAAMAVPLVASPAAIAAGLGLVAVGAASSLYLWTGLPNGVDALRTTAPAVSSALSPFGGADSSATGNGRPDALSPGQVTAAASDSGSGAGSSSQAASSSQALAGEAASTLPSSSPAQSSLVPSRPDRAQAPERSEPGSEPPRVQRQAREPVPPDQPRPPRPGPPPAQPPDPQPEPESPPAQPEAPAPAPGPQAGGHDLPPTPIEPVAPPPPDPPPPPDSPPPPPPDPPPPPSPPLIPGYVAPLPSSDRVDEGE